jgi:galactokinase
VTRTLRVRAPGRVNLIGEHTDYNDGFVLPAAIGYYTFVTASHRSDGIVEIRSDQYDDPARFLLSALPKARAGDWTDYPRGILIELQAHFRNLRGAGLSVSATLPMGAGLSSSASFEVAIALAMLSVSGDALDDVELARLAQRSDHKHVGIQSGIMDQFVVLHARAQHACFLDTRTLESKLVRVPLNAAIVIANTMVKHALASSEYNQRRLECEMGVHALRRRFPGVRALRDASLQMLERCRSRITPVVYRRCRHVISENARVLDAVAALQSGDLARFGSLMNDSHASLRTDYEVSCEELDVMVEIARSIDGVFGARMTGGGFGGCAVNLVAADRAEYFRRALVERYHQRTGLTPDLYDGTPVAGAEVAH